MNKANEPTADLTFFLTEEQLKETEGLQTQRFLLISAAIEKRAEKLKDEILHLIATGYADENVLVIDRALYGIQFDIGAARKAKDDDAATASSKLPIKDFLSLPSSHREHE